MIGKCECGECQPTLCVYRVPIFSTLSEDELGRVSSLAVREYFAKGEIIFMEGQRPGRMMVINTGRAKTFRYTQGGKEQILNIFSCGDFVGEMTLLGDEAVTYNAEALDDVGICAIRREDFQAVVRDHPNILLKVTEELCARLAKMETMVQSLGSKDVDSRVVSMLLEFANKYGRDHAEGRLVDLPLSREGMGNYIGVARETISRKLHSLQDQGAIRLVGTKQLLILDEDLLL